MAIRIQAAWRGYSIRKNFNIENIIAERKEEMETQAAIFNFFTKIFISSNQGESDLSMTMEEMDEEEKLAYKVSKKSPQILATLFDKHHLLRTRHIEGVLSKRGSLELSILERFLTKLQCKKYMSNVRKLYNEDNTPDVEYMFKDKKARKVEDMIRQRDHREGVQKKEDFNKMRPRSIHEKPFLLTSKVDPEPYSKKMLGEEEYTGFPHPVFRKKVKEDKDKRFKLDVKHLCTNPKKEPPYYIDHWKKVCCTHNFMYDFSDDRNG